MRVRMQIDYIQGMGARCAGSDPDIIALAQAAKAAKKIYITGRCGPMLCHTPSGELAGSRLQDASWLISTFVQGAV